MPRNTRCYEVLIASPGDVFDLRQIIVECIEDWNSAHSASQGIILQPRRWELDVIPQTGDRPQDAINRQIVDSSDILFGIFWSRLGTPTGFKDSGTVEEIDRLVEAGKPACLYFSQAAVPIEQDRDQLSALFAYKERIKSRALYCEFKDPNALRRLVSRNLAAKVNELAAAITDEAAVSKFEEQLRRLQLKLREREVTDNQIAKLKAITANDLKGEVTISKPDQDPEAVQYAHQLFHALEVSGWKPVFSPGRVIGGMEIGLRLNVYSKEQFAILSGDETNPRIPQTSPLFYAQTLKNALVNVGLPIDHFNVRSGPPIPRDSVHLSVGPKPLYKT